MKAALHFSSAPLRQKNVRLEIFYAFNFLILLTEEEFDPFIPFQFLTIFSEMSNLELE